MIREYKDFQELCNEVRFKLSFRRGRRNPIERWALVAELFGPEAVPSEDEKNDDNTFDRKMRDAIEHLRIFEGMKICNMSDGRGYYLAETRKEYQEFKRHFLGSAFKRHQAVAAMDITADQEFGKDMKDVPEGQSVMFSAEV